MLTILKSEIVDKLAVIKQVVSDRTQVEAAKGILFKDRKMIGTNLDMFVVADVDYAGEPFVLPAQAASMIELLPEGTVQIAKEEGKVKVSAFGIKSSFATFEVDLFPTVPEIEETEFMRISTNSFIEAASKTLYIAEEKSSNPALRGLKIGSGEFAAAENARFAVCPIDNKENEINVIVPKSAAQIVLSAVGKEKEILVFVGKNYAEFRIGDVQVYSKTLSGQFLNYQYFLSDTKPRIELNLTDLKGCLSRCCVASSDQIPKIAVNCTGPSLEVSLVSTVSNYREVIEIPSPSSEQFRIGMNAKKLLEIIRRQTGDKIEISFCGERRPLLIYAERAVTAIMPVLLKTDD